MTPSLPTVKVKRDGPRGWRIMNREDFDPKVHELWDEDEAIAGALADPIPLPDLDDLPEAHRIALEALVEDDLADWQSWHWKTKVKRAKEITGREDVSPDEANDILAAEAAKQAEA